MDSKQLKLGRSEPVFEERCYFCKRELKEPNFYKDGLENSYPLCSKHDNWKFKAIIGLFEPLIILAIPFVVFASLFGVEDKLFKTIAWGMVKLEDDT